MENYKKQNLDISGLFKCWKSRASFMKVENAVYKKATGYKVVKEQVAIKSKRLIMMIMVINA